MLPLSIGGTPVTELPNCDGDGSTDCGMVLAPNGSIISPLALFAIAGVPPGWNSALSGSICGAEFLGLGPVFCLAMRQRVELGRQQLEALGVAPLAWTSSSLVRIAMRPWLLRIASLEDFGLQIAAAGAR